MKIVRTIVISNPLGLHARPAAVFVQTASQYTCDVQVGRGDIRVSGKSIMGIMMLAAEHGAELVVKVDGDDAEECLEALTVVLNTDLDAEG
jgi:phosphocarrier protein HPr